MPEEPIPAMPVPETSRRRESAGLDVGAVRSHPVVLEAHGLVKHYRQRQARQRGHRPAPAVVHAAEDVDLELRAGRVAALVGESGSGKSTVARLLAHLVKPTSGEIILDGRPALRMGSREYRRMVQMVFQDPFSSLNPVHSIAYHLERPLKIHHRATKSEMPDAVARLLARVQLGPASQYVGKLPHELSGGQRQRVAIARALAAGPRVLLADEPISMLDVSIRLGILNLLAELRDEEGLAILYVTHDIASARYFADTMTVMYAGRMVESGPSQAVADDSAHPYTQLLLRAAPDPDRAQPVYLGATGGPPSLVHPPAGCRFHPRCPAAMDRCRREVPPFFQVTPGHAAACWLHATEGVPVTMSPAAVGRPEPPP
jgi:peptide/nickel transport system ATP-binding protein